MGVVEKIKSRRLFYKMGVMCGETLYSTEKFNRFDMMMQAAKSIDEKYGSDMERCSFVFQAFKDDSYDFDKSCFFQTKVPVNGIGTKVDSIAKTICEELEAATKERGKE